MTGVLLTKSGEVVGPRETPAGSLSEKQLRLTQLVAQGLNNRQIGTALGTTEHVAKNYLRAVYDKTGMSSRLELALWYLAKVGDPNAIGVAFGLSQECIGDYLEWKRQQKTAGGIVNGSTLQS